jgi:hypothetical protein
MDTISDNFKVQDVIHNMIDAAKEKKEAPIPIVRQQVDKALDLIDLTNRKGIKDKKSYDRARAAFEQNWNKLHPHKLEK